VPGLRFYFAVAIIPFRADRRKPLPCPARVQGRGELLHGNRGRRLETGSSHGQYQRHGIARGCVLWDLVRSLWYKPHIAPELAPENAAVRRYAPDA